MRDSDRNIANGQSSDKGNSSLVHNGSTLSQLDSLVTKVTQRKVLDRCGANVYNPADKTGQSDGICNNPIYDDDHVCASCRAEMEAEELTKKTFEFFAADVEQRRKERA